MSATLKVEHTFGCIQKPESNLCPIMNAGAIKCEKVLKYESK
jgi:hypothetical protein